MPTGHTYFIIEENEHVTLNRFLWRCAREFCLAIREANSGKPNIFEEESTIVKHLDDNLASAKKEMREIALMSDEEYEAHAAKERANNIASQKRFLTQARIEDDKFDQMRVAVEAWKPPTEKHQGLKQFALEQLRISMHGADTIIEPKVETQAEAIARLAKYIENVKATRDQTVKAVASRNEWARQLNDVLPFEGI